MIFLKKLTKKFPRQKSAFINFLFLRHVEYKFKKSNPMNNTKATTLYFKDSKSDKVYKASLEKEGDFYIVNFAYGKRDGNLKEGTKTKVPVTYEKALLIYDKLVKSKTDKGYVSELLENTEEGFAKEIITGDQDLTNFNLLKKLLKPFEKDLEIPDGGKLKDVVAAYDPKSKYTADCQRVQQLGLADIDLNDLFGWDYTMDTFLFEHREFGLDDFIGWHWLEDIEYEDIVFLNDSLYYIGDFPNGDGFFQISKGIHKGKLAFIDHETASHIGETIEEIDKNGTVDEIIAACTFIGIIEDFENLEDFFIQRIKSIKKKSKVDAKKIKALLKKSTALDLSDKKLTEIPPAIFDFPEITELNLFDNEIKEIPSDIEKLTSLKVLNLGNNHLNTIDENITKLPKLKTLDLHDNMLPEIPSVVFKLTQLKELNLIDCCQLHVNITKMPSTVSNLKNLKSFKLKGTYYSFSNYPEIKHLKGNPIDLNPLKAAYAAYLQKERGTISYIFEHGDKKIIKKVLDNQYNSKTKEMNLRYCRISFIPKELLDYDIKILNLSNCHIGQSDYVDPSDKAALKKKKQSDLEKTTILNKLTNLEELLIDGNDFHEIPNLSKLKKLRILDLSSNDLIDFTMPNLPLLEFLDLEGNSLGELPDLKKLKNLKKLDVASNDLERFTIAPLKNMEELHLSSNELNEFPIAIFTLKNLKYLDVSYAFGSDGYQPKIEDFAQLTDLTNLTVLSQDQFKEKSKSYKMLVKFLPADCEIK